MPLPFNKSLDLKLLKLVKDNPVLYDTSNSKYVDLDQREVVWQKIGDSLNRPALVCKARWVNIRDMMKRKLRERMRQPNQRSYNYKYEEELRFMFPYFKDKHNNSVDYTEFGNEDNSETETPTEEYLEETEYNRLSTEVKPVVNQITKEVFIPVETQNTELNPADPLDVFLLTIGSTLRKFSPYYLNQAKTKIFQIVQNYELQQIVGNDERHSHSLTDKSSDVLT